MATPAALFASQAAAYAAHRPAYTPSIVAVVVGEGERPRRVLDVGCGSGQLTRALAAALPASSLVEGVDAVQAQLDGAAAAASGGGGGGGARVTFRRADALATGAADASIDLLTVAQALHWFVEPVVEEGEESAAAAAAAAASPPRPFWVEAARVLRPRGRAAAISYGVPTLPPHPAATAALRAFHDGLGDCWDGRRAAAVNGMAGLAPRPCEGFDGVRRVATTMAAPTSLDGVVGLLSSWSAVCVAGRRGDAGVLDRARREVAAGLAADGVADPASAALTIEWPVTVLLATRAGVEEGERERERGAAMLRENR
jgi:SAM-dependent methyltransferase